MTTPLTADEFWSQVDQHMPAPQHCPLLGPCWVWIGSRNKGGYGTLSGPDDTTSAHRAGFVFQHGPIPPGAWVCHHCDNPPCVRGDHLYAGDAGTNGEDLARRKRYRTVVPTGDQSGSAKAKQYNEDHLGADRVAALWIVEREKLGMSQREFAKALGCAFPIVRNIEAGFSFPASVTWNRFEKVTGVDGWKLLWRPAARRAS